MEVAYDLKDKIVMITGGAVGIGAKVIEFMLEENIKHIAFLDILEEKGVALQDDLNKRFGNNKVKYYKCNVLQDDQLFSAIKAVKDEFHYIDVFINNAGIMNDSLRLYKTEIQLNVTTVVTCTLKAMEWMRMDKGGKGGVVINIASIVALIQDPMLPIYFATKSAVLQFSNCIGMPQYYHKTGVRVVTVCFGATDTALLSRQSLGTFDDQFDSDMMDIVATFPNQRAESAARVVLVACRNGESGSTWLSKCDLPAKDITDVIKRAYGVMSKAAL